MTSLIGKSLGRYHILEQIGRGGMATVYKAYDTRLERDVAVKIIRQGAFSPEVLERMLKRFEREAKSLAKLTHPNIIPVIDYGEHEGSPYLVMVYLQGGTLKERVGKPMPYQQAAALLAPVARALEVAHENGVIHRDIKPSNILLTEKMNPLLGDFGIAKLLEGEVGGTLTGTGVGVGTPEYMSPEQGAGRGVDERTDIYSLGVVFYELVTGRKPYEADTPIAVVAKQMYEPLPRPKDFVKDLPDEVERVLLKALAKQAENRYEDMGAFAAVLEKLAHEAEGTLLKQPSVSRGVQAESRQQTPQMVKPADRKPDPEPRMPEQAQGKIRTDHFEGFVRPGERAPGKTPAQDTPHPNAETWDVLQPGKQTVNGREKKKLGMGLPLIGGIVVIMVLCLVLDGLGVWGALSMPTENEPTAVSTRVSTIASTQVSTIASTQVSPKDGMVMVYVPEGKFEMGATGIASDERPVHTVDLDAFWIDQTEVTNAMYAQCVAAGVCSRPAKTSSFDRNSYYGNSKYEDYPVIYVNWGQAKAYCEWAGRRLPTEAEWEKAARGTDGRKYPWGNANPSNSLLNYNSSIGDTTEAGSYPDGASPYGALDMAGNVWEWVADWYDSDYYGSSPSSNPQGPASGTSRVLRGGSWLGLEDDVRSALRNLRDPDSALSHYGFRCAVSP